MFKKLIKKKKSSPDYILIITVTLLLFLGILILASVSAHISQVIFGNPHHLLVRQIISMAIGLALAFLAFKIPLEFLRKIAPLLFLGNLVLLAMVFIPGIGLELEGATRWIRLGLISFQPSEFLKITFILYLANWLALRSEKSKKKSKRLVLLNSYKTKLTAFSGTLVAFLFVISLVSLFLIIQPDIGTLVVIISTAILIYFLANMPLWHTALMFLMGSFGLFVLIKIAPYRMDRFLVFLNPELDPLGMGFHIKQAFIAIGSGGIFGVGLGQSIQKYGFLPQPIADSIFAVFAEETGFIGSIILIFLFFIFLWRGFRIGKLSQDKFSQLTAFGITLWIIIQVFVNIGSMIGLIPLTGIPLPFISHGGTALITVLIGVGILLNISKQTKQI